MKKRGERTLVGFNKASAGMTLGQNQSFHLVTLSPCHLVMEEQGACEEQGLRLP
jgi:hypothetical protein